MRSQRFVVVGLSIGLISACAAPVDEAAEATAIAPPAPAPPGRELVQRAYVKASNTGAGDQFGYRVALSGDGMVLAVGAPGEASAATGVDGDQASNAAPGAGAVYVFRRHGRSWIQQAYLKASNAGGGDAFGSSVALSADGTTLAVGAYAEASACDEDQADNSAPFAGAIYVFTRRGMQWSQEAYLKASDASIGDQLGASVALAAAGDVLAAGAANAGTDNAAPGAGAAYVFTRSGGTWRQEARVRAAHGDAADDFGVSVALSGDGSILAVGADAEDSAAKGIGGDETDDTMNGAGAVYVFARTGAAWTRQAYVKAPTPAVYAWFGYSVALAADGATLAVGAYGEDAAYVLARSGATWRHESRVQAQGAVAGGAFGVGVALSADGAALAVGGFFDSSAATGIDGNPTAGGAPGSGAAFLLARRGATWAQEAYVKASNTGAGDELGLGIALSADGATLAVGAHNEDSAATGIDGDEDDDSAPDAGAVYLFDRRR
jgi:hypothetical protein